jgi:aminocarboxymuconate-semialdehyde decarboxylase
MPSKTPVVDIHSHLYPPAYISLLESRTSIPYITTIANSRRLVNRVGQSGKPLMPILYDISTKLAFMNRHGIDISIISLGNPWLDFLPPDIAASTAASINDATNALCAAHPGRLFCFAALPLSAPRAALLAEISRVATLSHVRGVVMGSAGLGDAGKGLDDPDMLPVYEELERQRLPVFLHPNYGLPAEQWGPCCADYGQVPALALGFTMETTIAFSRVFLAGMFDKVPELTFILSHGGGTLPFLAGRIESCIEHDRTWKENGRLSERKKTLWQVLKKNVILDGVVFDKVGMRAAVDVVGVERVMFGTDHPFFVPLEETELWPCMVRNRDAARDAVGEGDEYEMIMGGNAVRLLDLK